MKNVSKNYEYKSQNWHGIHLRNNIQISNKLREVLALG